MFSIPSAPAKQSVGDTITILSGRLGSATLLEDRRAAILGLRSFAKDFPASVASGALRCLISSLSKDGEDVDTVKVVLETLLMLFNPNEHSPEASDEIALWLADEFTQRAENIALLLDFVESHDFYSRLYSLQLLSAILSARTERTEECIFTAPLGISRLVSVLDDQREAIRNEGISLLIALTLTSAEIQKLVAFENTYERIFAIIGVDGSLSCGGRVVEDCLILLANLLRGNASNQSLFRESGCILRLAEMLAQLLEPQDEDDALAGWAHAQRNRNLYAFVSIIRLFVPRGSTGTSQNQNAFWRQGLSNLVLQLAFSLQFQVQLRAEALVTCGDMIRSNAALQEGFAQLMVDQPIEVPATPEKANGHSSQKTYVIDGLLELILNFHDQPAFDLRFAACECLKAYFSNHSDVRLHFLSRAIDGFQSVQDESANILAVLLNPAHERSFADPYRDWFAAVIAFHLLYDNPMAKAKARGLTEGDASKGEEVVTSIQTITAHLLTGIRRGDDPRVLTGYLMLLLGWLFEDLDAVNDLLAEGSNVQSLIQIVSQPPQGSTNETVQGLAAMLLALVYEFSTKDSPIPRTTLHSILSSRLDRDSFLDRLAKLRRLPLLRDFEVTPQRLTTGPTGGHIDVYLDGDFVDFFKDNYSRLSRAIDRSPVMEISVIADGVEKGISRELVDSLREEIKEKDRMISDVNLAKRSLEAQYHQEQATHHRLREEAAADVAKAQANSEKMQSVHEAALSEMRLWQAKRDAEHEESLTKLKQQLDMSHEEYKTQLNLTQRAAQNETEHLRRRTDAEIADLRATVGRLEVDLMKANKSKAQELQTLQAMHEEAAAEQRARSKAVEGKHEEQNRDVRNRLDKALCDVKEANSKSAQIDMALQEAIKSRKDIQSELDDLLILFGDLEEKVERYKARLRELGQQVSDAEDDEDEDEDDEDGDGDGDDEDDDGNEKGKK